MEKKSNLDILGGKKKEEQGILVQLLDIQIFMSTYYITWRIPFSQNLILFKFLHLPFLI